MQTEAVKERFRKQRELMGLPPKEEVLQGSDGMLATVEQVEDEIKQFDEALQKGQDVDIGEEVEEEMSVDEGFMSEEPPSRKKVLL
jgi:large subunit ribosomal protein L28